MTGFGPIPTNSDPAQSTAQNGIQVYGADATITHTTVSGKTYTAPDYCPTGTCDRGQPSSTYYTAAGILVISAGDVTLSNDAVTNTWTVRRAGSSRATPRRPTPSTASPCLMPTNSVIGASGTNVREQHAQAQRPL